MRKLVCIIILILSALSAFGQKADLRRGNREFKKKEYAKALEWYEKYLKVARPGSKGYEFAADNVAYIKSELFMETP